MCVMRHRGTIQEHLTQTPKGHCPQVAPIQDGPGSYHHFCPNSFSSRGTIVELVSRRWTERPYK